MSTTDDPYIPPLRYSWLTALYDPLIRSFMREATFRRELVEQAHIEPGDHVLDLGCGTATLTLLIKTLHPDAEVVGLDADPKALAVARHKAREAGLVVGLDRGMAMDLPYPDDTFDHVFSSLLFHHLTSANKRRTLREVVRVLRAGGGFHLVDWGKPTNALLRAAFVPVQLLDGFETTADNVRGELPRLIAEAGFTEVQEQARYGTILGTLARYRARRPDRDRPADGNAAG